MKKLIRKVIFILGDLSGVNFLFRKFYSGKTRVITYHGVTDIELPAFRWTQIDAGMFRWQMDYIRNKYNCVPVSDLINQDKSGGIPCRVIITFDDGLENVYTTALPILRKAGLKASCFIHPNLSRERKPIWTDRVYAIILLSDRETLDLSEFDLGVHNLSKLKKNERVELAVDIISEAKTWPYKKCRMMIEYIDKNYALPEDKIPRYCRLMTPDEIKKLTEDDVFEIGTHTDTHPILSRLDPDEQEKEICEPIRILNEELVIPSVPVFAYPNGRLQDYNETSIELLKKCGIKAALTTIEELHDTKDDPYQIKRILIGADIDRWEFKAMLSGFFFFLKGLMGK